MTEQPADDDLTAIRARVWEVCARTGIADEQLAEAIGADPGRIAASFACERRFSTYELAAIAEHGGTTVEWLCGDSDEYDPNARIRAAVEQLRGERQATPERDGYTIGVFLPPGVSEAVRDRLADQIADAAHDADDGADWDAHVVGLPGDVLGAVDGVARP